MSNVMVHQINGVEYIPTLLESYALKDNTTRIMGVINPGTHFLFNSCIGVTTTHNKNWRHISGQIVLALI